MGSAAGLGLDWSVGGAGAARQLMRIAADLPVRAPAASAAPMIPALLAISAATTCARSDSRGRNF